MAASFARAIIVLAPEGAADKAAEEARMGLGTGLFNTIQGAGLVAAGAMTGTG